MAILDTSKKPLVNDRDTPDSFGQEVFVGIDLPFAKHAAIIEFSVAPTLILGNFIVLPLSLPFVLAKMYPSLIL